MFLFFKKGKDGLWLSADLLLLPLTLVKEPKHESCGYKAR